jgi:hypothetical protein
MKRRRNKMDVAVHIECKKNFELPKHFNFIYHLTHSVVGKITLLCIACNAMKDISFSQRGFRGTLGFHKTSVRFPREVLQ